MVLSGQGLEESWQCVRRWKCVMRGDGCCLCGMSADEGLEIQHWSISTYLCLRLILTVHVTPGTQSSVSPELCQVWSLKMCERKHGEIVLGLGALETSHGLRSSMLCMYNTQSRQCV